MENKSPRSDDQEDKISVCDIMKEDTSEIIKKMESQMPSLFQNYSDLYAAYLHMFDDIFGTCYLHEKKFFDSLNIDQGILRQIKKNSELIRNSCIENLDIASKLLDEYTQMRVSAIKSFDRYYHTMMESYAKMLSQYTPK
jgi:hypothetical protein